jgi:hypothetical protein
MSVRLRIDPVPEREVRWLELRSQAGAATRLVRSARPAVRIGQLSPVTVSPAERELSDQAFWLIELHLTGTSEDILSQRCSAALAMTAQIQGSAELDPASELPDQLRQLCAVLTEQHPADGLPRSWSGMLDAARWTDGPRQHLDIGAALPPIDGVALQVDILTSVSYPPRRTSRGNHAWTHTERTRTSLRHGRVAQGPPSTLTSTSQRTTSHVATMARRADQPVRRDAYGVPAGGSRRAERRISRVKP